MVNLHSLVSIVKAKKKRLGRGLGSGAGAKSGRGTTRHQSARAKIPIHFEGGQNRSVKRYPLLRGKGKNKSVQYSAQAISLTDLSLLEANTTVTLAVLFDNKIINNSGMKRGVKIVASGTLTVPLHVTLPVSRVAKEMIEKAGGTVVAI